MRRINGAQRANEETHARLFSFQVEPSWALVLRLFVFPSGCFSSWISSCLETFKLPSILLTFFSWFLMVCKITWVHTIWLCNWCNFMVNVLYLPFAYRAKQRFLSCIAFSVNKVIRVSCLSRSWFSTPRDLNKPTTRTEDTRMTSFTLKAMQERNFCSQGTRFALSVAAVYISLNICMDQY